MWKFRNAAKFRDPKRLAIGAEFFLSFCNIVYYILYGCVWAIHHGDKDYRAIVAIKDRQ